MGKKTLLSFLLAVSVAGSAWAWPFTDTLLNDDDRWFHVSLTAEAGFLGVLGHTIQFGTTGTEFDYVADGGQNVLFPFTRFAAEINLFRRHSVVLLIQPLDIVTNAVLSAPVTVYGETFAAGTPMDLTYGFTFYRFSYLFYFINDEHGELAAGLSLQIRNASIRFESSNGAQAVVTQNIGPVPILKVRGRYIFPCGFFVGAEADGFYASSAIFNGADYPFEGAIVDASVFAGWRLSSGIEAFINIRYLGGGARGTERNPDVGDGYTNNWLHTMSFSLGLTVR
ncbi:MAG: hypothetical protein JXD23_06690 [Spirochaetales bacterium]|nr:hypothetical protein [Spirochaetales bacterium]